MTDILIIIVISFVTGAGIGAYATWMSYHAKEREQEAVLNYIRKERTKNPPPSSWATVQSALKTLSCIVDSYNVTWGGEIWSYRKGWEENDSAVNEELKTNNNKNYDRRKSNEGDRAHE